MTNARYFHATWEWELTRWIVLLVLAGALLFVFATSTASAAVSFITPTTVESSAAISTP